jgi:hypothetical protein
MSQTAVPSLPPPDSAILQLLPCAQFHDAWAVEAGEPDLSALEQFLKAASATPRWVNALMKLRNRAVALVGLKNLGTLAQAKPAHMYEPRQRVGIFTLISKAENEVLLGDSDKHLDVTLSVHKSTPAPGTPVMITVTTVVHVHNLLGRIYMLPVAPMHKLIVPAVLKAVAPVSRPGAAHP